MYITFLSWRQTSSLLNLICPPSTYLRTDSKKMQVHGTVIYTMKSTLLTCLNIYAVVRVFQKVIVNNYAKICYGLERILFFFCLLDTLLFAEFDLSNI